MIEWLLKDEKAKVGRPKLALDDTLKKARLLIIVSILASFVLFFCFISEAKGIPPYKYAYHLTFEKLFGSVKNYNGFNVSEYYDNNKNFVLKFKTGELTDNNLEYKYIIYELKNNNWKKIYEKKVNKGVESFEINLKSKKNKNRTFKINMYVKGNGSVNSSFMPYGWEKTKSKNDKELISYKIVTVKGYYSPVSISEINDKKEIHIDTPRNNPRKFILKLNGTYKVLVKYTDETGKYVLLSNKKATDKANYLIPRLNKVSNVVFKIYGDKNILEKNMPDNWRLNTDKKGNTYITNTYVLKPDSTYK